MFPSCQSRAGSRAAFSSLIVAVVVVIASLSSAAYAQALKPVKALIYPGLIHQQNLRVAIGAGIFKKHGLDVTLVQVENGPAGIAAVQGGSIDLGVADSNLPMLSNLKGSDFQITCGASGLYFAAIAGPKLPLPNLAAGYPAVMKDFVGKNLGVTGLGASSHFFWLAMFKGAGIDPTSATYVPVGLAASAVQALRQQRIDAYMGFDPVITIVRDGGLGGAIAVDTRPPASQGPREITQIAPQLVFYAKRSYLAANADTAKAFNDALIETSAWQKVPSNLDKIVEIMMPAASIGDVPNGDAVFRKMIEQNIPVASQTKITREGLVAWIRFMQEYANYPKDTDAEKTINDLVWKGACQ